MGVVYWRFIVRCPHVQVLEMEREVLNVLKFELTTPTTLTFLRRFTRAAQTSYKAPTLSLEFLGSYLAELTLLEYEFLPFLPSMIAASSVYLAKITLDSSTCPWDATLQHYTGYRPSELEHCVKAIHELQLNTKSCSLPAVREKYRQHKVSPLCGQRDHLKLWKLSHLKLIQIVAFCKGFGYPVYQYLDIAASLFASPAV